MTPSVSVVIPTRERPSLLLRALRSVLAQTFDDYEVIVVLDGTDAHSAAGVTRLGDARVRLEELLRSRGPGAARNAGVRTARAELVAFLDDDDEWHPEKLQVQLDARRGRPPRTIVTATVTARQAGRRDRVWPTRLPRDGEPLGDYLLARRGLRWGETLVQTSTLLAPRSLLLDVPFREDLPRHEDYDWLLRANEAGAPLVFAEAEHPLATWHIDPDRPRASRRSDTGGSLDWIRSVRRIVSPRAYAAFLLAWVVPDARGVDRLRLLPRLLWESVRFGRPSPVHVAVAVGSAFVPARLRS